MADSVLIEIKKIAAAQLKKAPDDIRPNDTFASLGADDLDLVEITMATEEQLGVLIADDALIEEAGVTPADELVGHLTPAKLANVVAKAPKHIKQPSSDSEITDDNILREAQVGPYSSLSKLPNPNSYVLVSIPSLEVLIAQQEQQLGRKMTDAEFASLKAKAAVIALPEKIADEMKRKQADRQGGER